jgi:hypothetical protein
LTKNFNYFILSLLQIKGGGGKVFTFSFKGGVVKPTEHSNEKFLLFFLVGEQEVPFYQMLREGIANRKEDGKEEFVTKHQICKLFTSRQGFGIQKQYNSFYIRLDPSQPMLKILPFSGTATGFYFSGRASLMKRDEVLESLPEKSESRIFFTRQEVLPLLNKMVMVDRSEIKEGVRNIKIGKKGE